MKFPSIGFDDRVCSEQAARTEMLGDLQKEVYNAIYNQDCKSDLQVVVNVGNGNYLVIIKHDERAIASKTIPVNAINFREIVYQMAKYAIKYVQTTQSNLAKIISATNRIPVAINADSQWFESHSTGQCKYKNLGHIRYAFVRLEPAGGMPSWLKVYTRKGKLLFDKTIKQFIIDSERQQDNVVYMTKPPGVRYAGSAIHGNAMQYLAEHESEIIAQIETLPINTLGIRESTEWPFVALGKVDLTAPPDGTGTVKPVSICTNDELLQPGFEPCIIVHHNNYAKGVIGFAQLPHGRPMKLGNVPRKDYRLHANNSTHAIIVSQGSGSAYPHYAIRGYVRDDDEYLSYVLEQLATRES